jgi:hypothetical protein
VEAAPSAYYLMSLSGIDLIICPSQAWGKQVQTCEPRAARSIPLSD